MKSETALDSVVFQLTPTRTRCELVIKANGKSEKIASGLLNPFVSHLKTAKDQIAKGGYSITLEPDPGADTPWFTKGTVERFVRFVSTPEVLERVNTVELEIIQMEEAISMQANEILHSNSVEEDISKSAEFAGANKSTVDSDPAGKAIVLYKPGNGTPSPDSSAEKTAPREENSKVQLLKVLENRKTVLQKEQGMAFARAMAAGFTVDNIAHLISFAECFGAARLLEACSKFMALYHGKHETGQWLEIDAADAMSLRSDFAAMNLSGITLSAMNPDPSESCNGKINTQDVNPDLHRDVRTNGDANFQGQQYAHPMFHQWPAHSPPGMYQPYPMQGMPFYPSYPPYFAPPYTPSEASTRRKSRKSKPKKKKKSSEEESGSNDANSQSLDEEEEEVVEEEEDDEYAGKKETPKKDSRKKSTKSAAKKSGMVVIKNLNYIASKKPKDEGSSSSSASEDSDSRRSSKHSKAKTSRRVRAEQTEEESQANMEEAVAQELVDSGNWQVFQSFLLRQEEDEEDREKGRAITSADAGMFSSEKKPPTRKPQGEIGNDPLLSSFDRDSEEFSVQRKAVGLAADDLDGRSQMNRHKGSTDYFHHPDGGSYVHRNRDVPLEEIEGGIRRGGYRRGEDEEFIVYGGEKQFPNARNSSDPIADYEFGLPKAAAPVSDSTSSANDRKVASDESFIVPVRSGSPEAIKSSEILDSEFLPTSSTFSEIDSSAAVGKSPDYYEPEDLSMMMPERDSYSEFGYDPAMDYEMEARVEAPVAVVESGPVDEVPSEEVNKEKKKPVQKRADPSAARSRILKPNMSAQAQARAEKLRAYKADLQKAKKEKEEEAIRRLEALKLERQKRIAARSSGQATASKFSDSPTTPSALQRRLPLPLRTAPPAVSRSVSSLPTTAKKTVAATPPAVSRSASSLPTTVKKTAAVATAAAPALKPKIASGAMAVDSRRRESDLAEAKPKGGGEEIAVVEKIVVMMEREEKVEEAAVKPIEREERVDGAAVKLPTASETVSAYAAVCPPPMPVMKCEAVVEDSGHIVAFSPSPEQPEQKEKTTPLLPPEVAEEDPAIVELEEKPRSKGGFKKLLKFGRKSSSSAGEGDEPFSAGTEGKSGSRHFSILSSFRSNKNKNSSP